MPATVAASVYKIRDERRKEAAKNTRAQFSQLKSYLVSKMETLSFTDQLTVLFTHYLDVFYNLDRNNTFHATLTLLAPSLCVLWPTCIQLSSTTRVTKHEILHRLRFIFIVILWLSLPFLMKQYELGSFCSSHRALRTGRLSDSVSQTAHKHTVFSEQVCPKQTFGLTAAN